MTAWLTTDAKAPMYPAKLYANAVAPTPAKPAVTADPPVHQMAPHVAAAGSGAGAGTGAPARAGQSGDTKRGDTDWRMKSRPLQYADKLTAARVVVITTSPAVTDITIIDQRLQALQPQGITLSQFARRWAVAPGGALHVEASSPAMHTALLEAAAKVRRATYKTGLIDMVALQSAQQPDAKAPSSAAAPAKPQQQTTKPPTHPRPDARDGTNGSQRGRNRERGRGRGRGRYRSRASDRSDKPRRSPSPIARADDAPAMRAIQQLQREMQHMREQMDRPQYTSTRRATPPPIQRLALNAAKRMDSTDAEQYEEFKRFEAFKARKTTDQTKAAGAAAKRERTHRRGDGEEEEGGYSDADTEHAHDTATDC